MEVCKEAYGQNVYYQLFQLISQIYTLNGKDLKHNCNSKGHE